MDLPFDEAIDFFRQKVNLPTQTWKDLRQGMHARAFVVAGAMKENLLSDLRTEIQKGIEQGTTLSDFRKQFDGIVQKHGWSYKGAKGWRSSVMFNTNLSVAYHTGHYKQMTDPDVLQVRSFWRYVESSSDEPRPEHEAWYNVVLRFDDPWWDEHYPPNGWGCKCGVVNHSAREVERLGKEEALQTQAPKTEYYDWKPSGDEQPIKVPAGIDPGWDYNPGKAAWGQKISQESMRTWKAQGSGAWETMTQGNWQLAGRPRVIPADPTDTVPMAPAQTIEQIEAALKDILGGEEQIFPFVSRRTAAFSHRLVVNARSLAEYIDPAQSQFLPFLPEIITDPFEVWMAFERHRATGKVALRQRIVKALDLGKDQRFLATFQAREGVLESWTFLPTNDVRYLNKQRKGMLVLAR
jgi:hypothetical protein